MVFLDTLPLMPNSSVDVEVVIRPQPVARFDLGLGIHLLNSILKYCHVMLYDKHTPAWFRTVRAYRAYKDMYMYLYMYYCLCGVYTCMLGYSDHLYSMYIMYFQLLLCMNEISLNMHSVQN